MVCLHPFGTLAFHIYRQTELLDHFIWPIVVLSLLARYLFAIQLRIFVDIIVRNP
jgi:hypothetical protein